MAYSVGCQQGTQLSPTQIRDYAAQAGFQGRAQDLIVAIALRESCGGWTGAVGYNPSAGCNAPSSYDRGLVQINDTCHPYPDSCVFDPLCAMQAAFAISQGGTNFSPWSTLQQALRDIGGGIISDFTPSDVTSTGAAPVVGSNPAGTTGQTDFLGIPNPLNLPGSVGQWFADRLKGVSSGLLKDLLGPLLGGVVNVLQRAGIFVLGGVVILGGLIILAGGEGTRVLVQNVQSRRGGGGGAAEEGGSTAEAAEAAEAAA